MKKTSSFKIIALVLVMLTIFAACVPTSNIEDFLDDPNLIRHVDNKSDTDDKSKPPTEAGHTEAPDVEQIINILPDLVAVVGTCEQDAVITIKVGGSEKIYEVNSINGYFIAEVYLEYNNSVNVLEVKATKSGLKESAATIADAYYRATAEKRIDGLSVSIGANSALVMDAAIDRFLGKDLISQSQINTFVEYVNGRVKVLETRAEGSNAVSLVYVLIPDSTDIYPEWLPEITAPRPFKTKYQQYCGAIEESNAILLDMTQIFLDHKDDGELLFNRTDNKITEYAAYLVYSEMTKLMEQRFPSAKARALSEFTKKTEVIKGGNMVDYLGLDGSIIQENVTRYIPTFNLKIGNGGTAKYLISDMAKYLDNSLISAAGDKTASMEIAFRTERTNLPSAIICKDESVVPMFDFLAERFNNVSFRNTYTVNITQAQLYATSGKKTVDYMFMIASASSLDNLQETLQAIS